MPATDIELKAFLAIYLIKKIIMIANIIDKKTIKVFDKTQFNWHQIRHCGQIFIDSPCKVFEQEDGIIIEADGSDSEWLFNYFDLGTDYNEIKNELLGFTALKKPIETGYGIRILRQPFERTLISFIISANNNIKRFTRTLEQIDFSRLKEYTLDDFKAMGAGYRADYLVQSIDRLSRTDISALRNMDSLSLQKEILSFKGVGKKVCNCIMLFSDIQNNEQRFRNCPIDTWIQKAIEQLGDSATEILSHKYSGVAQQYIFYYLQHLRMQL